MTTPAYTISQKSLTKNFNYESKFDFFLEGGGGDLSMWIVFTKSPNLKTIEMFFEE